MRSNYSKRESYSNLINEQIFELEKLILQTAQQTENKKLEAENHLEKCSSKPRLIWIDVS